MVVELMGLPGSGKTYLCNALVQSLQADRIHAVNLVDQFRTSFFYKIVHRLARMGAKMDPVCGRMRREMRSLLKCYQEKKAPYSEADIFRYVDQMLEYCFLYRMLQNKKSVYLFDEGVYQQLATMITNFELSQRNVAALLMVMTEHVQLCCVSYETTVEQARQSIQERNRHTCFIDELSGPALQKFLETYQNSCIQLGQQPGIFHIKRENPLSENLVLLKKLMTADGCSVDELEKK